MDKRIEKIRKLSGVAVGIIWVVQAILVATVVLSVFNWVYHAGSYHLSAIFAGVSSLVGILGLIILFFFVLGLLSHLRRERTPFTAVNVKRFKRIALCLALLALLQFLTDLVIAFGISVMEVPTAGGPTVIVAQQSAAFHYTSLVLIVLALVVYSVALAFEYGAALQQESDETL